jgi:1,4-alpha-glucan branching enzyme
MGDEANLDSPFPFFFDLPAKAAKEKRDDRYDQMKNIFHQEVKEGDLPEPNEAQTFLSAKLSWEDIANLPERRDALARFRQLARWRRERLWPLAATPCVEARTARQGNSIIVTWEFEAGRISMALNPTSAPVDLACIVTRDHVTTGSISIHGELLRLGPWSAVSW